MAAAILLLEMERQRQQKERQEEDERARARPAIYHPGDTNLYAPREAVGRVEITNGTLASYLSGGSTASGPGYAPYNQGGIAITHREAPRSVECAYCGSPQGHERVTCSQCGAPLGKRRGK
jgi:hypothetical protein